jgi:hypothetical protein
MQAINYYDQAGNNINYPLNGVGSNGDSYILEDPFVGVVSPYQGFNFPTSTTITLSPRKMNFQPSTLGNTQHIYNTPSYIDVTNLVQYFSDWGFSIEVQEGPQHTVTVQIPFDTITEEDFTIAEPATEIWELQPDVNNKGLLYNGFFVNPFSGTGSVAANNFVVLPDVLKAGVQRAYENKLATISLPPQTLTGSGINPNFIPFAQQALAYMNYGVEGVPSYGQILKRSQTISVNNQNGAFQTPIDNQNSLINANGTINYIRSTNDMQTNYSIPDTVKKFMLPSYTKQFTSIYDPYTIYAFAGWLIKPPTIQWLTRNKLAIQQEFIWSEWLWGLYLIASKPSDFGTIGSNGFPTPIYSPANNPSGSIF